MDRSEFWAMVDAARTASRGNLSRQLELAAARLGDLPPPEPVGYRRMELLAARLGDLPLTEVVGVRRMELLAARLGDLPLTEVVGFHRVVEELAARLGDLPLTEVVGFHRVVEELEAESFRVDLWGAALVIHRMGQVDDFWCSEDSLWGFREWLVEQGRQVYEAAIADPDSLADDPDPKGLNHRAFLGCLARCWQVRAGAAAERTPVAHDIRRRPRRRSGGHLESEARLSMSLAQRSGVGPASPGRAICRKHLPGSGERP